MTNGCVISVTEVQKEKETGADMICVLGRERIRNNLHQALRGLLQAYNLNQALCTKVDTVSSPRTLFSGNVT
jgi:hypothetical protein